MNCQLIIMDLNIKGNPGSNNRFEETLIEKVESLYPNATKVVNDHSVTIQINFTLKVNLNGKLAISLFKTLRHKFHLAFEQRQSNHFDGESHIGASVCQFSGSPSAIAAALWCIGEMWGDDATETIRYASKNTHFERSRLTLSDALKIAEDESRL